MMAISSSFYDSLMLLVVLVVFRIVNSLFVRTYFNPDEFWQGPEVAHHFVFGYGHLTWEWQQDYQIRGYSHPLLFATLFKVLQITGCLAGIGDYFLYKLAKKHFGQKAANWSLICQVVNWFNFYCLVRCFSNSLESVLTNVTLYYWDFQDTKTKKRKKYVSTIGKALSFAAITCVIRPSNAILWIFLGGILFISSTKKFNLIFQNVLPNVLLALGLSLLIDRLGYNTWTFVPYNFFKFNVLEGNDRLYGVQPMHWYFTQGFPAILGTMLPFFIMGALHATSHQRIFFYLILWTILIFSCSAHKEFRFILPLLSPALLYSGHALSRLDSGIFSFGNKKKLSKITCFRLLRLSLVTLVLSNGCLAIYLSRWHQSAPLDVLDYISQKTIDPIVVTPSIDFLTSCHSTPYYSHLHKNISLWFPDCSPMNRIAKEGCESHQLEKDPLKFVEDLYSPKHGLKSLPVYIVTTSRIAKKLDFYFKKNDYREEKSFFHAHTSGDSDDVEVDEKFLIFSRMTSLAFP